MQKQGRVILVAQEARGAGSWRRAAGTSQIYNNSGDESESLDQSPATPPTRFVYANAGEPSTNQPTD